MLDNIRVTINTVNDQVRLNISDPAVGAAKISADADNIIERKLDGLFAPTPSWSALKDKPNSSVNDIDQAVADRHTHDNKSVIDDLSDNAGALEYRGLPISDQAALDTKVDKVTGHSLVDDDEIAKLLTVEQDAQKNTVSSVAGKQGDVLLDREDVGLGAVDNTSDTDKPVSTAVADALAGKVDAEAGKQLSDENYTLAEKEKLSGVAVEATKNRDDSENADKVHPHAISDVTGLPDRLNDIDALIGELSISKVADNRLERKPDGLYVRDRLDPDPVAYYLLSRG